MADNINNINILSIHMFLFHLLPQRFFYPMYAHAILVCTGNTWSIIVKKRKVNDCVVCLRIHFCILSTQNLIFISGIILTFKILSIIGLAYSVDFGQ